MCSHDTPTYMQRSRLSQRGELAVRLMQFRGYHIEESFRDNVIRHDTAAASSREYLNI